MIAPFNRRDSAALSVVAGVLAIVVALSLAPAPLLGAQALGLAGAAVVLTLLVLSALLCRLPPDLPLRPMPEPAIPQAIAPSPSGPARLRVAVLPEALSWYRLDLYLDGVRVGQLRPGTALVRSMPPGPHALTIQLWLRRLGSAELINALPGTDIVVRGGGGRVRQYSIERRALASVLADRHIVLMETPGS
jgi:hypothetical protein